MKKDEFLLKLKSALSHLSKSEVNDVINFYDELIQDKIDEDNLSEEEIISCLGSIDDIVNRITKNTPKKIKYDENENTNAKLHPIVAILAIICLGITLSVIISFVVSLGMVIISIIPISIEFLSNFISFLSSNIIISLFNFGLGIILIGLFIIIFPNFIKISKFVINYLVNLMRNLIKKGDLK